MFWEGLSLFRRDDLEQAQRVFRRLAARYPDGRRTAEAYYRSGMCAVQAGRHDEAVAEFERAEARLGSGRDEYTRSLEQEILYQRASSLLKSGRRDAAAAGFTSLAQRYPDGTLAAEGLFALAQDDFRRERYRSALQGFVELLDRFPARRDALSTLYWAGVSAVRAGEAKRGLEYLLRYLESSPQGGLARVAAEEIRAVLASLSGAAGKNLLVEFYRRAEDSRNLPEETKNQIRYEYAVHLFPRDRPEALRLLQAIRASAPAEPLAGQASFLIGRHHRESGELGRALDIFRGITASSSEASAASAQLEVAGILETQARSGDGSFDEAAEEYLKVYFLYPDFPEAAQEGLYQAGRVFWEQGKRDRARSLFEKLADEFPQSPWLAKLPQS
jgi:TolA-binding protein